VLLHWLILKKSLVEEERRNQQQEPVLLNAGNQDMSLISDFFLYAPQVVTGDGTFNFQYSVLVALGLFDLYLNRPSSSVAP